MTIRAVCFVFIGIACHARTIQTNRCAAGAFNGFDFHRRTVAHQDLAFGRAARGKSLRMAGIVHIRIIDARIVCAVLVFTTVFFYDFAIFASRDIEITAAFRREIVGITSLVDTRTGLAHFVFAAWNFYDFAIHAGRRSTVINASGIKRFRVIAVIAGNWRSFIRAFAVHTNLVFGTRIFYFIAIFTFYNAHAVGITSVRIHDVARCNSCIRRAVACNTHFRGNIAITRYPFAIDTVVINIRARAFFLTFHAGFVRRLTNTVQTNFALFARRRDFMVIFTTSLYFACTHTNRCHVFVTRTVRNTSSVVAFQIARTGIDDHFATHAVL